MEKNDILAHYMVHKKENQKTDILTIIRLIINYVQNNKVYFKYEPTFWQGVLIFGIIGYQEDHDKLKELLGTDIDRFGGVIKINSIKEQ